jgi:hypothetical protein
MIGLTLFFGVPILMMLYGGIKLLFRIIYTNRWLNISAGIIWLVGFLIALYVGMTTGKDFGNEGKIKEQVQLAQRDTLYLSLNSGAEVFAEYNLTDETVEYDRHGNVHVSRHNDEYHIGKKGDKKTIIGHASLDIVPSLTDNFELFVIKQARGEDRRSATERARAIEYKVIQKDSLILFDELFTVNAAEKFRVQEVTVVLKVPRGKVIHLNKNLENFIWDVENVTNTYDGDMVNRRWIMNKEGLECIDCEGIEANDYKYNVPMPPPPPGHPGGPPADVNINSKDANVKIDKDGIKIKSKDGDVNIDKNGIHIETKDKK